MSYRFVKRILGETSLERKCLLLFAACLILLITGTFWWVHRVAEELVMKTTHQKGRDLADVVILNRHWEIWTTDEDEKKLRVLMSKDLLSESYKHKILVLEKDLTKGFSDPTAILPEDSVEEEIMKGLQQLLQDQRDKIQLEKEADEKNKNAKLDPIEGMEYPIESLTGEDEGSLAADSDFEPVFISRRPIKELGEYYYYQPVYWKPSCTACHLDLSGPDALPAADQPLFFSPVNPPFYVIKVMMPSKETRDASNRVKAILLSTAIITVLFSVFALHFVVRYVVIKPLTHLRDVSDKISHGDLELRAELNTNDEFEQLATSFNRMLRHLVEAQDDLLFANENLDAKVDELAQLNMRLHEMNQLKSDFMASMSHELRTPLNSIIGFSDVLQGIDSLNGKQKRYAGNIQKSGHLLLEMINDILDMAKMEAGKMDVRPSEFPVGLIVQGQCDMVRSLSEEKNIDLDVEVAQDLPLVYQDQSKVQQILTNLLSNAIKFTPEGGRIMVTVARDRQGRLQLTVADTGVGISEEDGDVIFEKFRQGAAPTGQGNLTREYSGTGLGLSIVKELCKLLGGEIDFQSELGKGSEFIVKLPWICADQPLRNSQLNAKLKELTKPRQRDFVRHGTHDAEETITTPPASSPSAPPNHPSTEV